MPTLASPVASIARAVWLLVGLAGYGISIALIVRAGLGVGPWDVLALGVAQHTGLPFGIVVNAIGAVVLLLWFPIRQRPGLGTAANVVLIGPFAQLGLVLIPAQTQPWQQAIVFGGGLALLAVSTGLYIGAGLGPGPRDGLMTGLHRRTGWPIWAVRAGIESSVLVAGWLLGGQVGVGTVAFALLIGPMVNLTLPLLDLRRRANPASLATPSIRNGGKR